MYKHILIATDGSELATKALEHGLALAKHDNAHVSVATVTEPWAPLDMAHEARQHRPDPIGQFEEMATTAANRILDGAATAWERTRRDLRCRPREESASGRRYRRHR